MTRHTEQRILNHSAQTIYDLVSDVERYPEFLPWVLRAKTVSPTDRGFVADLTVGYKLFQETYRSHVILSPHSRVEVEYIQGPFKHLHNSWQFTPLSPESVLVDFLIDFEFQSFLFQKMIQPFFTEATQKMIAAFEGRAKNLEHNNSPN